MAASPLSFPDPVIVENISTSANRLDIVALFDTHIGKVRKSEGVDNPHAGPLKISFFTLDASQRALSMSGYMFAGRPLVVRSSVGSSRQTQNQSNQIESRRNLYVLGLPFTLTKSEFAALFSRFGTVCHCVILATLDNASRRRGFVVMSNHEEARLAMSALSRVQFKGHMLDISWAVVQRSQGFLDGGDRRLIFEPPAQVSSVGDANRDGTQTSSNIVTDMAVTSVLSSTSHKPLVLSPTPTSSLLVTNLPVFLFSQSTDLHPLLLPFGKIQKLEILPAAIGQILDTIRVVVEYSTSLSAQEAKTALQGQFYSDKAIVVDFIASESSTTKTEDAVIDSVNMSNLNPYAPAFVLETSLSQPSLAKSSYQLGSNWANISGSCGNTFIGSPYASLCGSPSEIPEFSVTNTCSGVGTNIVGANDQCVGLEPPKLPTPRGPYVLANLSNVMNIESSRLNRYF